MAAALATPEPGYYTQNYWPTRVTPYSYSTCYGCYGKRSAEAEPGYLGYGYGLPAYGYGYGLRSYGYGIGRVSTGIGLHPTGAVYESRSAQGLGKRSADAEPGYLGYGYGLPAYSYGYGLGLRSYGYGIGRVSTGVGLHPTGAVYESRSAQGLGKRSADAEPGYLGYGLPAYGYGYGYGLRAYGYGIGRVSTGVGLHPTGAVYESRSAQGLGKRSANAEPGYYTQNYWPTRVTPYSYSTCYGCYGKRSADAEPGYFGYGYGLPAYGYGYGIGGVSTGVGLHPTGSVYESRSAQGLSGRYLY